MIYSRYNSDQEIGITRKGIYNLFIVFLSTANNLQRKVTKQRPPIGTFLFLIIQESSQFQIF